jgi:hypothetical protein
MGQMDLRCLGIVAATLRVAGGGLRRVATLAVIAGSLTAGDAGAQQVQVQVSEDPTGAARITTRTGSKTVRKEPGQVGIEDPDVAWDRRTAGWLVMYEMPGVVSYPIAGMLVVWRGGAVIRRFRTEQTFWSWAFVANGKQVAYHTGPLHGERASHCELRNVSDGRLVAQWSGDLDDAAKRPAWTAELYH